MFNAKYGQVIDSCSELSTILSIDIGRVNAYSSAHKENESFNNQSSQSVATWPTTWPCVSGEGGPCVDASLTLTGAP